MPHNMAHNDIPGICACTMKFITEVWREISMADSLAQLTARAQAAENAVDGLAR